MEIHYTTLFLVTFVQFIFGALWYSPLLFGKQWMDSMGTTHVSPEEIKKMQKSMMPFYILQFAMTLGTNIVLFLFMRLLSLTGALSLAGLIWIAFFVPTQISGVIWGNTPKKKWLKQILIMISFQLLSLLFAGFIFGGKI